MKRVIKNLVQVESKKYRTNSIRNYIQCLLILGLVHCTSGVFSQIRGDGNWIEKSYDVSGLTSIDIQFNAQIILDYNVEEKMKIEIDANVISLIGIEFENGELTLDQIKWIEPSMQPKITIGCPGLESVFQGTHSTTIIKNVAVSTLTLAGNVGKIIAEGSVDKAVINSTGTKMNLQNLETGSITMDNEDDDTISLNTIKSETKALKPINKVKSVSFKIKNNSFNRNQFYVKGPNNRGGKFSYGFAMMPYFNKSEKWTIGTEVYLVKKLGKDKLLLVVNEDIEGETVRLFN